MRIVINMEIETEDYEGKKFKKEIDEMITGTVGGLISDVNEDTKLISYEMYEKKTVWSWGL